MKIVVLDGYTLNPGDISWEPLKKMGTCVIHDRSKYDEVAKRAEEADILLSNKVVIDKNILESLPNLKYIGVLATGYNIVDIETADRRKIVVCNVPAYSSYSVAQSVFSLLLELTNFTGIHNNSVHEGDWCKSEDFCYRLAPLNELAGKKMGIIGYGNIGELVARIADAFGMELLVNTRTIPGTYPTHYQFVTEKDIFRTCDVISLHCPLTEQTDKLINASTLEMCKSSAILINTSRGQLIDELALANALKNNQIAAAGLDVLTTEPPEESNPLLGLKNCVITPHIAWSTLDARRRLLDIAINNVRSFIDGRPKNRIRPVSC